MACKPGFRAVCRVAGAVFMTLRVRPDEAAARADSETLFLVVTIAGLLSIPELRSATFNVEPVTC